MQDHVSRGRAERNGEKMVSRKAFSMQQLSIPFSSFSLLLLLLLFFFLLNYKKSAAYKSFLQRSARIVIFFFSLFIHMTKKEREKRFYFFENMKITFSRHQYSLHFAFNIDISIAINI